MWIACTGGLNERSELLCMGFSSTVECSFALWLSVSVRLPTPAYRHCTQIKLLWARVAVLVFEHDLTRDALLENEWS